MQVGKITSVTGGEKSVSPTDMTQTTVSVLLACQTLMENTILIHLEETVIKADIMYPVISILFHDLSKSWGNPAFFFCQERKYILIMNLIL